MKYDIIIVGGGLAGLTAALKLSQNGKKVAVFEKHHMPGGYATNFKRKDKAGNLYVFDVALHGIGGLLPENAFHNHMKDLNMLDKVEFLRKEETATIFIDNTEIDVPDSFEKYRDHLIRRYRNQKDGIMNLFDELYNLKLEMESGKPPMIFQKMQSISLYDYIKEFIDDERFIEEFSFLWLYYGLPPKKLNALFYMLAWLSYHIGGTFYIEGGAGKFSDTFAEEIKINGGDIYLSSEVVKIDKEGTYVTAIHTKKGEKFIADEFIFSCDPNNLISLMDTSDSEVMSYKRKLDKEDIGISLSQLYIGLDCKTTEVGINKSDYFINKTDSETSYENILKGDYLNNSFGITSYDVLDPKLNKDVGVMVIVLGDHIQNWPKYKSVEYKNKKNIVTEQLLELLYEKFPKVKGHIKILELGTPHTMKRYTNNSEGAVYGWEQSIKQGGFNRLPIKSDFSNMYLAGSWTNPGGGFEGAITGGILTANRILKKNIRKDENTFDSNDDLIDPDMELTPFLAGMVANFDSSTVTKDQKIVLEFIFDDNNIYYIKIKNKKIKLLREKPSYATDVTIKTTYKVWYNIAFGNLEGKNAMFDGQLTILGNVDIFLKIPEYFNTDLLKEDIKVETKELNPLVWLTLTLVPWILCGVINTTYSDGTVIALLSILYTAVIMIFVKPKQFKEITVLEGLTFIGFTCYGLLDKFMVTSFDFSLLYIMDIGLILAFLTSAVVNKPITSDYSKQGYKKSMVKTKLFHKINIHLTMLWTIIFTVQLLIKLFIPHPWNNLGQICAIIGLIISHYYPKIILGIK